MSYFVPYVDASGLHYPTYNDIIEQLVDEMQTIYGSGIYLGADSQDYQMLSKIAEKIYDTYQAIELAYNAHSPLTSIGTGLDYIVALNGISRKQATRSVVTLSLTGSPGTTIEGGAAADNNGLMWDFSENVTIGQDGTAEVEATAREYGLITAAPNSITRIMTPVMGWESVTNVFAATVGTVTESDSELRARQGESVALPSRSMVGGLYAALKNIPDVARCAVYENDTGDTDANGVPGHSVCCVVEGGEDSEVARAIFMRKGLGCGTYGSESAEVVDDGGMVNTVNFERLGYADIDIEINITTRGGWTASLVDEIKTAIVNYLDSFTIGTDLTMSIIWMVAQTVNADARLPQFSITSVLIARHGETLSTADVEINYNEAARGRVDNITINIT